MSLCICVSRVSRSLVSLRRMAVGARVVMEDILGPRQPHLRQKYGQEMDIWLSPMQSICVSKLAEAKSAPQI